LGRACTQTHMLVRTHIELQMTGAWSSLPEVTLNGL